MSNPSVARACWITGRGRAELRDEPLAEPAADQVRVRTAYSAVSRGTERLVLEGRVPDELVDPMAAPFQAGRFPWPVKYGYCNVGVVEAGALPVGTRVFCLYPHQDRYVVPVSAVTPLPDPVPTGRAVLAANLETAVNAVWDGGVGPGDRVVVVGAGVVGALIAWLCGRIPGAEVHLIDLLPERRALAESLGVRFGPASGPADVVFHASASAGGLQTAIACAGRSARVVEASWHGAGAVEVPLGGWFFAGRLSLVASQVGAIPADRAPRWDYARRLALALRLLEAPALDALIDGESSFEQLPTTLPAITRVAGLCHRVRYP